MKKEEIDLICQEYDIKNYTINNDGSIDVDGDVDLYRKRLTELPLKFGKVTGYFTCLDNKITSLEGSPYWVGKDFSCTGNLLKTLNGCPSYVGQRFKCDYIDNEYVTIHEVYCLFNHKSYIRDKKLKELLEKQKKPLLILIYKNKNNKHTMKDLKEKEILSSIIDLSVKMAQEKDNKITFIDLKKQLDDKVGKLMYDKK